MIVADASVIVELLLQSPHARAVEQRLFSSDQELCAPHLLDVEVAQVVRGYLLAGEIDERRGQEMLQDYLDLPFTRYPHELLLRRVWELRNNVTAYDAVYIALAEALEATLVTRDSRLGSVPGTRTPIDVLR